MGRVFHDDDGYVRVESDPVEPVDSVAGMPICRWCGQPLYEGKTRHEWHHQDTGSRVCSGQIAGAWSEFKRAEPTVWTDAEP